MPTPSRTLHLPTIADLRTCHRWSCSQRSLTVGPDLTSLNALMERVIHDVAAMAGLDIELAQNPKPVEHYLNMFVSGLRDGLSALPGPAYPEPLLAAVIAQGVTCVEGLIEQILPHLRSKEELLAQKSPFAWTISDGHGGRLRVPGIVDRVGKDRLTGTIRAYDWRIADHRAIDWMAPVRSQQIGTTLGWLRVRYPECEAAYVEVFLGTEVTVESTRTSDQLAALEEALRLLASRQAAADQEWARADTSPVVPSLN